MTDDTRGSTFAPLRLHRRRFVQGSAAVAGGATAAALAPSLSQAAPSLRDRWTAWLAQNGGDIPASIDDYTPQALSDTEIEVLKAATGRLIPADDLGPGAIEAGVFIYIDRLLAGRGAETLPLYQQGLAALDAAAADGGEFAGLTEAEQDEILTQLEAGEVADAPEAFFALLLEHTRQGMFGDPIHGGNREFIGWDLIRYPGIKLVWTAEDQAIDAVVEPEHISVEKYGGQA